VAAPTLPFLSFTGRRAEEHRVTEVKRGAEKISKREVRAGS
jgi:hypothetical protein